MDYAPDVCKDVRDSTHPLPFPSLPFPFPLHAVRHSGKRTLLTYHKQYKQTGFCGFGDNCKFLHDRSDYKQGWQLDKEWETVSKGRNAMAGTVVANANRDKAPTTASDDEDDEEAMLDNIPFACVICRGPYKAPVTTRCGHYFCEGCALKRYR